MELLPFSRFFLDVSRTIPGKFSTASHRFCLSLSQEIVPVLGLPSNDENRVQVLHQGVLLVLVPAMECKDVG